MIDAVGKNKKQVRRRKKGEEDVSCHLLSILPLVLEPPNKIRKKQKAASSRRISSTLLTCRSWTLHMKRRVQPYATRWCLRPSKMLRRASDGSLPWPNWRCWTKSWLSCESEHFYT